ncbi:MAG TPA: hypothetical protein VFI19_17585 [Nocardioides sp.]|nr:hypothetical protein [Nocardioides sp.]
MKLMSLLAAVAVAVLSLSPAAAPAAMVHSVDLADGPGDTWTYSDSTSGYALGAQPAADVLSARISHGRHAVQLRLRFDDLQRVGSQWYWFEIHTTGATSWFIVEARKHDYVGTAYQSIEGEWARVPGVSHHLDYATDEVTLRVSRRLLGDPPWVRVRLRFELGLPDGTFFTDNPMNAGRTAEFTRRLATAA